MKIGRQITEALLIDKEMSKREAREAAIELLGAVGIRDPEQRFEQYPFQFSGGMRQRVVIAIALARNPEVLICDEPTTALDVTVQARILNLINELKQKRQLSIIFITHDLGVVAHMADRVYVMYAGKIVEYGTAEDIFLEPAHPYARALLASVPDMETEGRLASIPGAPPNMLHPPTGDGFAPRNKYAMQIDFEEEPPMFRISDTHYAATWSLHPSAPEIPMPDVLRERIRRMRVVQIDSRQPILEVENLRVVFASGRGRKRIQVNAVDGVSFEIYQGETFGLVGESGCGKTTLGRTIVRLYSPTSGTIRFRGRDVSGPMTKELRQYITQHGDDSRPCGIAARMTVQEIIEKG